MTALDEAPTSGSDGERPGSAVALDVSVSSHRSSPGRTVFTEEGNTDGWIATDLTVGIER